MNPYRLTDEADLHRNPQSSDRDVLHDFETYNFGPKSRHLEERHISSFGERRRESSSFVRLEFHNGSALGTLSQDLNFGPRDRTPGRIDEESFEFLDVFGDGSLFRDRWVGQ